MSKVPLSEQIEALQTLVDWGIHQGDELAGLKAAIATLRWVEKHLAELRVLGEFPIEKIEVLTPSDHGSSAIAQERDEGGE
jgi:hypothetical protein